MTGNRAAAEDLVQDVFLRMLKYRATFRDEGRLETWMFRIARNARADYFRARASTRCARGVALRFIRPGKPIENAYVESFNGKFRDECLNEHWFVNRVDAQTAIDAWRVDYNTVRPHSSLGGRTPDQFAAISGVLAGPGPLAPMRLLNPRTSRYPRIGCRGQVNATIAREKRYRIE